MRAVIAVILFCALLKVGPVVADDTAATVGPAPVSTTPSVTESPAIASASPSPSAPCPSAVPAGTEAPPVGSSPPAASPPPPSGPALSPGGMTSGTLLPHRFSLPGERFFFGSRLVLTPRPTEQNPSKAPYVKHVSLVYQVECPPESDSESRCWRELGLDEEVTQYVDGRSVTVSIPQKPVLADDAAVRWPTAREVLVGQEAWLCVAVPAALEGAGAEAIPAGSVGSPCQGVNRGWTEAFRIELANRFVSTLLALLGVLLACLVVYLPSRGLLERTERRWEKTEEAARRPRPYARIKDVLVALISTQDNRMNLPILQVFAWTLVVLFGQLFVWNMTDQMLTVSSEVLILLGLGGGTALNSIMQTQDRPIFPSAYLELVGADKQRPQLSDLVTVGNRPNIFKLQMLFFTASALLIVLSELLVNCTFPTLPGEYLTLMGISSGTYVLNSWSVSSGYESVRTTIDSVERGYAVWYRASGKVPADQPGMILPSTAQDLREYEQNGGEDAKRQMSILRATLRRYFLEPQLSQGQASGGAPGAGSAGQSGGTTPVPADATGGGGSNG